jgi:hypothetical protein
LEYIPTQTSLDIIALTVGLKQRIAAVYGLLAERMPHFPKAQETWYELAESERYHCEKLAHLAEHIEIGGDGEKIEALSGMVGQLEKRARAPDLKLEEAYQISLDLSSYQVELMAYVVERIEFPQSLEIKNMASTMSASLLQLYDMVEKYTAATDLRSAVMRTKVQLLGLQLTFLEFDVKNYLTAVLGLSHMLAREVLGERTKTLLEETYQYSTQLHDTLRNMERVRRELTSSEKKSKH